MRFPLRFHSRTVISQAGRAPIGIGSISALRLRWELPAPRFIANQEGRICRCSGQSAADIGNFGTSDIINAWQTALSSGLEAKLDFPQQPKNPRVRHLARLAKTTGQKNENDSRMLRSNLKFGRIGLR